MKRTLSFLGVIVLLIVGIVCATDYTTTVGNNWLITGATIDGATLTTPTITLGTINNTTIGASTPTTGAFTSVTASTTATVTGNLRNTASIFYAVKTKKITIGHVGSTGEDFQFTTAANTSEQVIDSGAIVPAFARVIDIQLITTEAAVFSGGATTLVAEIGSSSSGNQYAASATIYAIDVILSPATGTAPIAATVATAGNVFVAATPGANWSTMTAGEWTLLVTYIDSGAIK
jgi:hypothetical protein